MVQTHLKSVDLSESIYLSEIMYAQDGSQLEE